MHHINCRKPRQGEEVRTAAFCPAFRGSCVVSKLPTTRHVERRCNRESTHACPRCNRRLLMGQGPGYALRRISKRCGEDIIYVASLH